MKYVLGVIAALVLAACGADGEPEKPKRPSEQVGSTGSGSMS